MPFNDWMFDIETTGLRPDRNAILSIGAVQFDRETFKATGKKFFTRVQMPRTRFWDEATRNWWSQQKPEAFAQATDPVGAVQISFMLANLMAAVGPEAWFWAKPVQFDWSFVESYWSEFGAAGVATNLSYRRTVDVRSYLLALPQYQQDAAMTFEQIADGDDAHTPIADANYAIGMLRAAFLAGLNAAPELAVDAAVDIGPGML